MRTFTCADGKSNKFWNIELKERSFTVQFGKAGTTGQTQVKEFANEAAALKAHDKLVAEKLAKGYRETTAVAPASAARATKPTRAAAPGTGSFWFGIEFLDLFESVPTLRAMVFV